MLKNYLKITLRNLARHKAYSFINIFGLAIGIACCLLILLYVRNEVSYDQFHENEADIYRIGTISTYRPPNAGGDDQVKRGARTPVPFGPALQMEFPEISSVIRFWRAFDPVLGYQDRQFREDQKFYFADPGVFDVFSFELTKGDPKSVLSQPNSIVLTEAMVNKYFGKGNDPMGKIMHFTGFPAGERDLIVTGVMADLPGNTHFDFEFLVSLVGVETEQNNWGSWKSIWTYVHLTPDFPIGALTDKMGGFADKYLTYEHTSYVFEFESIRNLHLFSAFPDGFTAPGDITMIYLFSAIGFFILFIACINFMNLATARSLNRAKEVGLRKVLGAFRRQLIRQFVGEAVLLSAVALVLAIGLFELFVPVFNSSFNQELSINYLSDGFVLAALVLAIPVVGLLAGSYPALFMSRFRPVTALSGRLKSGSAGARIRRGLVIFQFVISVVLILATVMVYRQLDYVGNKHLGFDRELLVVLPYGDNEEALKSQLLDLPAVVDVAVSQRVPVNRKNSDGRTVVPGGGDVRFRVESYIIDDDFLKTYRIPVVAGKDLSPIPGVANDEFIINETAAEAFGWVPPEEALGKPLTWSGSKQGQVVGVIRDFHHGSLREKIEPLVLHYISERSNWKTFMTVRLEGRDLSSTLTELEAIWKRLTPAGAYDYFFIDESLAQLHRADRRFGEIFNYFAVLAVLIACLGLFGLASFTAEQRTKEIGVRKVLGASVPSVIALLSLDFVKLVLLSNLIAWPIAWFMMDKWLDKFAYHASLSFWVFMVTGALALLIALVTVSTQALRAALSNPIKSLRYE